jgi:hypothetical protein
MEVSTQLHALAALPPGKELPVPIGQEVAWTPGAYWTTSRRENSWSNRNSNCDPLVAQLVASSYTDYAIPALYICLVELFIQMIYRYHLYTFNSALNATLFMITLSLK